MPPSVREVADLRSDEGSQSTCAQAARAHTFVPSDKSMQKRSVTIHCLVLYKYTLSPPSTANLPKRFGLQTLPDTHQCRSISLFIKSPPACVCWFTKRGSFTDAYFQSDERVGCGSIAELYSAQRRVAVNRQGRFNGAAPPLLQLLTKKERP